MTDQLKEEENSTMDDIRESLIESTEPPPEPEQQENLTDPKTDPTANVETGAWADDRAPSSWSPKVRESWGLLPEDVRKEIIRREEAAVSGVRMLQEKLAPAERLSNSLTDVIKHSKENLKMEPENFISTVMNAHVKMAQVDVKERFQMLLSLADVYKIPLRDIVNESVGAKVLQPPQAGYPSLQTQPQNPQYAQLPPEVMQEISTLRQYREGIEFQSVSDAVDNFSNGREFFEDVRFKMGELIESGIAGDMEEAYEMAIWLDPEIRDVMQQRESASTQQQIAKRQASAARVNIGARKSDVQVPSGDDEENDSIADSVRAAFRLSSTRRL